MVTIVVVLVVVLWILYLAVRSGNSQMGDNEPCFRTVTKKNFMLSGFKTLHFENLISLLELNLSGRDKSICLTSGSKPSLVHFQDLENMSCTCPDFRKRRASYPQSDSRRFCKHLIEAVANFPKNQFIFHLLSSGYKSQVYFLRLSSPPLSISCGQTGNWFNICLHTDNVTQEYGYNAEENRWSYGIEPPSVERDRIVWSCKKILANRESIRFKSANPEFKQEESTINIPVKKYLKRDIGPLFGIQKHFHQEFETLLDIADGNSAVILNTGYGAVAESLKAGLIKVKSCPDKEILASYLNKLTKTELSLLSSGFRAGRGWKKSNIIQHITENEASDWQLVNLTEKSIEVLMRSAASKPKKAALDISKPKQA